MRSDLTKRNILGVICTLLLAGILYAGLAPFHSPINQVTWVTGADALRFGEHGTIFTRQPFLVPERQPVQRTIEMWVQPVKLKDSNTLLAFYDPSSPRYASVRQEESDLVIRIESSVAWRSTTTAKLYIPDAFIDGKRRFWTVTFSQNGVAVYRDGSILGRSALIAAAAEVSGQLIFSGSPIFDQSWSGVLTGLAVYDSALDVPRIAMHYDSWAKARAPDIISGDRCIGLYLFDEHAGNIIHNRMGPGDLFIPHRYVVLRKTLLDPLWRAFSWDRGFWQDAFINVSGFVPFGCFFCACFSARGFARPATSAILFGATISLFIEVTQKFLPTRDSSMADVINNVLGSAIGAVLYRGAVARGMNRSISRIAAVFE